MLPSVMEHDDAEDKQRVNAWVFLDVSGSCSSFVSRFWDLTKTIPKRYFDARLFSFDTSVYEIIKGKILGGGGTSFSVIEASIREIIKRENKRYPDAVIVITDGAGNYVDPLKPKNWHWIMPCGSTTSYCNTKKKSTVHNLEDFE